ncbi:hypothetical protein CR513_51329, partial [Mucuna pruriens]
MQPRKLLIDVLKKKLTCLNWFIVIGGKHTSFEIIDFFEMHGINHEVTPLCALQSNGIDSFYKNSDNPPPPTLFVLWRNRESYLKYLKVWGVLQRRSKRPRKAKEFGPEFCSFSFEDDPKTYSKAKRSIDALLEGNH